MKKKGNPHIPDFSRKRPNAPTLPDAKGRTAAPPPAPVRVKPPSTSAKGNRRGQ